MQLVDNIGSNKSEGTSGNINVKEFMDGTEEKNSKNDLICTSADESDIYAVDKVGKVASVQANESSAIDQLVNSLNVTCCRKKDHPLLLFQPHFDVSDLV